MIDYFLKNRLYAVLLLLVLLGLGLSTVPFDWQTGLLPRSPVPVDAIPNLGDPQQIVYTEWAGHSPQDVEDQVTYPLTTQLLGLEGVVEVMASVSGVVTAVHAVAGMYVKEGTPVAEVADFSVLWLEAELSQGDLAVAMQGDSLFARVLRPAGAGWRGEVSSAEHLRGEYLRGEHLRGERGFDLMTSVDLVDPIVDPVTRTGRVRGTVFRGDGDRAGGRDRGGDGDREIDENRTVPAWRPGQLLAVTWTYQPEEELLLIPESAVLWTGEESIVYTMEKRGTGVEFRGKRVKIGQKYGNFRHVVAGLEEGEEVVENGAFRVDSEFQLAGRPGMIR